MMKGDDMRVCVDGLKALAASSQKTIHTHTINKVMIMIYIRKCTWTGNLK